MTNSMRDEDIVISHDQVTILDQVIRRPQRISPSQWLEFWEKLKSRKTQP